MWFIPMPEESSAPKMPAIGSKWRVKKANMVHVVPNFDVVTKFDIEYWESDLTGRRLADFLDAWEPVPTDKKSACTCGGQYAGGTHTDYCDSLPNPPAPFRMPKKLSF